MSLDASGHLLLAEGHLRKAVEKMSDEPPFGRICFALRNTQGAIRFVTYALKHLKLLKEEPCNAP